MGMGFYFILYFKKIIYLFIFREREREGEREGEKINVREKHQLTASHMPPARDLPTPQA